MTVVLILNVTIFLKMKAKMLKKMSDMNIDNADTAKVVLTTMDKAVGPTDKLASDDMVGNENHYWETLILLPSDTKK